jgi:hypothetical protein
MPVPPVNVLEYSKVVNFPVFAVVAPTVPLILIDAVPVKFVTVPLDGVPNAPLKVTNAPAEPTLVPSAVKTPVPVVVVAGALPAPPPIIKAFAINAADVAQVDAELKYGIPPEVPATVKAGVVVGVATVINPPVNPTDVTVPTDIDPPKLVEAPLIVMVELVKPALGIPVKFAPVKVGDAPLLILCGKLNVIAPVEAEAIT